MKLIIAIVQDEDSGRLISALMKEGYGVTKLATTGGFLRSGNTTLLTGVQDEKLDSALAVIERVCKSRRQTVSSGLTALEPGSMASGSLPGSIEIMVGARRCLLWKFAGFQSSNSWKIFRCCFRAVNLRVLKPLPQGGGECTLIL